MLCVSLSTEVALLALVVVVVRCSFFDEDGACGGYAKDCEGCEEGPEPKMEVLNMESTVAGAL